VNSSDWLTSGRIGGFDLITEHRSRLARSGYRLASILAKLHLENRIQAAVQAVRSGIS
jgi:hypothetical protein